MFWGITPALNFFEELPHKKSSKDEINILIIGGTDARHVLKTISKKYQHQPAGNVILNFYIMEQLPETYAKQILLLYLALQSTKSLGSMQKTRMFMEIYGNMLTRTATARYLTQTAKRLIEMITNLDQMKNGMPILNINLKYKERDYIENLFKFWASNDSFDILDCWDKRLRKTLGVRYDTRHAAFDWDLHMNLHQSGAKNINSQEYQSFRRNGIAFAWLETEVARTNRSMVTGVITNGDNFGHYGYLGDMQTGPFIAYGVECKDDEFLKKSNNVYKYRSTDITERNLREIFHEMEFRTEYSHLNTSSLALGSTMMKIPEVTAIETGNVDNKRDNRPNDYFHLPGVTINLVSMKNLPAWKHKEQFKDYFDVIYYTHLFSIKNIDKDVINHVSSDECVLIIENPLYAVNYRQTDLDEHLKQVEKHLEGLNMYKCECDIKKDAYIKYILK